MQASVIDRRLRAPSWLMWPRRQVFYHGRQPICEFGSRTYLTWEWIAELGWRPILLLVHRGRFYIGTARLRSSINSQRRGLVRRNTAYNDQVSALAHHFDFIVPTSHPLRLHRRYQTWRERHGTAVA